MRSETEFDVYQRLIQFLCEKGWTIVCASPPAGTDNRFRKCLLPRRDLEGGEKGPRDEVDLIAHDHEIIFLVECKPRLSESMRGNSRSSESDHSKLARIAESFSPARLSELLSRATGVKIPDTSLIALALAVGEVDCAVPSNMTVMEFGSGITRIWPIAQLRSKFPTHTTSDCEKPTRSCDL